MTSAALLFASCGSSSTISGEACSRGGTKCGFDCAENLGCVSCLADGDCDPGAPFCVLGRCEACVVTGDCGAGQACFPREHTCEAKCAADADCADVNDAHICDPNTGACVGCIADTDCPADKPICEPTRGQCGDCASNADCGAASPVCDIQEGDCEQCLVDADCDGAFLCGDDHECHPACEDDSDCADPGRKFCDIQTHACVECLANTDCVAPAGPICTDNGRCVECVVNADCASVVPVCHEELCVECDDDRDCPVDKPKCDKSGDNRQCVVN